jgi:hypothetical protein
LNGPPGSFIGSGQRQKPKESKRHRKLQRQAEGERTSMLPRCHAGGKREDGDRADRPPPLDGPLESSATTIELATALPEAVTGVA